MMGGMTKRAGEPRARSRGWSNSHMRLFCADRVSANASTVIAATRFNWRMSLSSKAWGLADSTSKIPRVFVRLSSGTAIIDRAPSCRQAARSTRGSISASSHSRIRPFRAHIPENPNCGSKRVPTWGAVPCAATQTVSLSSLKAMAAPVARVADMARSSIIAQ